MVLNFIDKKVKVLFSEKDFLTVVNTGYARLQAIKQKNAVQNAHLMCILYAADASLIRIRCAF